MRRETLVKLHRSSVLALAVVGTAALSLPAATTASASDTRTDELTVDATSVLDALTLPPVPDEMLVLATEMEESFGGQDDFHTIEIAEDRSELRVWWHGQVPADLEEMVSQAPFSVVVAQTELRPADLRDAAVAAVENPELGVASAAPTVDGTGLNITLENEPGTSVEALSVAVDLEAVLGLPVEVAEEEAPVAYNRQADRDGVGGARTYRFEAPRILNGCTTGFAVRNGAQQGLMFAAHCGAVGNQMVVWPGNSGSSVFGLAGDGVINQRYEPADGAIIRANTTIPAIYTGAWNNHTGILVSGWRTVPVGTEMCFSGSYSGFVCGNVVTQTGVTYRLDAASGGAFTVTSGVRSEQATGVPSAGQGDSGGPSVVPVLVDGQARIMAGSIISAGAPSGQPCLGDVPNRICGSSVLTTPVGTILSNTGWSISTP